MVILNRFKKGFRRFVGEKRSGENMGDRCSCGFGDEARLSEMNLEKGAETARKRSEGV